ncbi:uncharacterized protein LOC6725719 isoform X1 [Drosophila simulans]|uniref:uncharacterized protein LOC6725719 isoform X1 n=1 Tax=Drosophila simulans TaxID=7240 RepID=UPI00078AF017|nr:uncharacterized protein LOC6725719 isoform X1 [Drosophila simulans]XP_016038997.1 uncharacterized protein LOC6725719 isoform X1 [Drosophila simulans]XP_039152979.1 uncharacterized protein LOC6725719 isoform X1 [Drosophila simulans]KMZ09351.1 uncharacterized protein Dsimw501_GD15968, isoform A [Drosophila simulans]KMZ09352.1 uncharacterized protein Dsimw501_GD15968, isoform B [Drosophila simulans]KMZ09353.1 uncharacterized protein Dsimw501_GD15968, isoform C [Drosophila simulans]
MRVVAMVSGGKDSCYNMMQCVAEGHEIVALANLHPKDRDELDSFMYQTVGHMGIEILASAMGLPLYRRETKGKSTQTGKQYVPTDDDEVEDLYSLLETCKHELQVDAVAVGAILSDYQRVRVENVCSRLNLISLAYLWRRDQTELLQEMIDCQVHAIIIKVAALGLVPDRHLGKSLREMQPHLLKMRDKYGLNVCGEGGEYETFTLDCPLFRQRIVVEDIQTIISSADPICPVGYINFTKLTLQPKEAAGAASSGGNEVVFVKRSLDYISDLNESTYSDLSDPDFSETELELIEKETRLRESLSQSELISRSNSFGRHLAATASSPIPIVTKSASVDEPTAAAAPILGGVGGPPICSTSACASMLLTTTADGLSSLASSQSQGGGHGLGSSTAAVCGSLSLAISSLGLSANTCCHPGGAGGGVGIGVGAGAGAAAPSATTQPPSPLKYEREFRPLANEARAAINAKGWMWLAGIQGSGTEGIEQGMQQALDTLRDLCQSKGYDLQDLCYVTLYVRSIGEYSLLNRVYHRAFDFHNPPTRVCVECPLPDGCHVVMEAIAYRQPVAGTISSAEERDREGEETAAALLNGRRNTMHVQGISHWAPANIGPYSQSTRIGDITYISGQIALVPGSMTIIEGGIRPQCKLTLRHISRIAKAMNAHGQLRDVVHGICFVTHPAFIGEARRQWERRTTNAIMDYIVLPALPREALVEWQVWAHTHNDRFDYEETGCSVGDYTISIRRRWNYENNCAAIVCYVSTGLASSTTQLTQLSDDILGNHCRLAQAVSAEHLDEIFTYVVNRLLKDYPLAKKQAQQPTNSGTPPATPTQPGGAGGDQQQPVPSIHLKLFYQVNAAPATDLLLQALHDFRLKCQDTAAIVYTVLPACSLHNFSTFLSICGVRHE